MAVLSTLVFAVAAYSVYSAYTFFQHLSESLDDMCRLHAATAAPTPCLPPWILRQLLLQLQRLLRQRKLLLLLRLRLRRRRRRLRQSTSTSRPRRPQSRSSSRLRCQHRPRSRPRTLRLKAAPPPSSIRLSSWLSRPPPPLVLLPMPMPSRLTPKPLLRRPPRRPRRPRRSPKRSTRADEIANRGPVAPAATTAALSEQYAAQLGVWTDLTKPQRRSARKLLNNLLKANNGHALDFLRHEYDVVSVVARAILLHGSQEADRIMLREWYPEYARLAKIGKSADELSDFLVSDWAWASAAAAGCTGAQADWRMVEGKK